MLGFAVNRADNRLSGSLHQERSRSDGVRNDTLTCPASTFLRTLWANLSPFVLFWWAAFSCLRLLIIGYIILGGKIRLPGLRLDELDDAESRRPFRKPPRHPLRNVRQAG